MYLDLGPYVNPSYYVVQVGLRGCSCASACVCVCVQWALPLCSLKL